MHEMTIPISIGIIKRCNQKFYWVTTFGSAVSGLGNLGRYLWKFARTDLIIFPAEVLENSVFDGGNM